MKYPVKALVFFVVTVAAVLATLHYTPVQLPAVHVVLLGLFMALSSILVHHFTVHSSTKEPKRFPSYFMAITGIKMVVYLAAIGIYTYVFRDLAVPMLVIFLALYLMYMILEVRSILKDLRDQR